MSRTRPNRNNCFLCRMMRGLAFGGLGAALLGVPARWLGADHSEIVYASLFGALLLNLMFNRPAVGREQADKHKKNDPR